MDSYSTSLHLHRHTCEHDTHMWQENVLENEQRCRLRRALRKLLSNIHKTKEKSDSQTDLTAWYIL